MRLLKVDPTSAIPRYLQVEDILAARISAGEWAPGQQIPTETDLCDEYGVSRVTVRQALARLVHRGILERERGRGTFVRDPHLTVNARSVHSFSNELHALGLKAGSRLLTYDHVQAAEAVASDLECEPGTDLVRVFRVRTADNQPIALQTSLLLAELVPDLEPHLANDMSLYRTLREYYGIAPVEAREVLRVTSLSGESARLLDARDGSAAFDIVRVAYDGRRAYERTSSLIRGDRYEIRLALRNI